MNNENQTTPNDMAEDTDSLTEPSEVREAQARELDELMKNETTRRKFNVITDTIAKGLAPSMYKLTTLKQLIANRKNALKSKGPLDTTSTRYNAMKHGLTAKGITELDEPEKSPAFFAELEKQWRPVGIVEEELVRKIGLDILRVRRAAQLEAREWTALMNPLYEEDTPTDLGRVVTLAHALVVVSKTQTVDQGLPAITELDASGRILSNTVRYETAFNKSLERNVKLLILLQELRQKKGRRRGRP